jgi:hypothetical protein
MHPFRSPIHNFLPALALALAGTLPLQAQDPRPAWSLSGFGTLGVGISDSHLVGFKRDGLQGTNGILDHPNASVDSRLGLQVQGRLAEGLDLTLQAVSKNRYDDTFKPQLTMAFLNWNPVGTLQVRAGRFAVEQILGAASLDVGYSYLWVRPNVETFGLLTLPTLDGGDVSWSLPLASGTNLKVTAFGGTAVAKAPVKDGEPYDFKGSPAFGVLFQAQHGPWEGRLSLSRARLKNEFPAPITTLRDALTGVSALLQDPRPAQVADALREEGAVSRYLTVDLSYMKGPLEFRSSYSRVLPDRLLTPKVRLGYASLGYRAGSLAPFVVFSRCVSNGPAMPDLGLLPLLPTPEAALLTQGVRTLVDNAHKDQRTFSAGVRWDWADNADLKFQVDHVRAHDSLSAWNTLEPGWKGKTTVFTVTLDFVLGRGK